MIVITLNKLVAMKSMQEIERRLMAEFTVEVMTGNSIDVQELPGYSDDFNVQMMVSVSAMQPFFLSLCLLPLLQHY